MVNVYYKYTFGKSIRNIKVTDTKLKETILRIAENVGNGKVWLTSGDRTKVPKGGSTTSRHLHNMGLILL